MKSAAIRFSLWVMLLAPLLLTACGGGGGSSPATYTIGGTISGLTGTVVLQNNGSGNLTRTTDGGFTFATALANGAAYNVTVLTQPPGQTCTVSNGSGTVAGANIANVQVNCVTKYTIGGAIAGHTDTVVLQNNGGNSVTLSEQDGNFVFDIALTNGANYNVTVLIQPAGQTCTVSNGSGTVSGANITNVQVSCADNPTYTIGGTISGLSGTVVLQNNAGDNLTRASNGGFTFATVLANGSGYNVTVFAQPAGQTCTVASGSGVVNSTNVTNVQVNCVTNPGPTYTIGGTISGLTGTVVLQNNSGDNLARTTDGGFTFATELADGAAYNVTVHTQPGGQTCSVSNPSGNVSSANVANVAVTCANNARRWSTAALIETGNRGSALFPQIAVDVTTGNALAVWSQSDGTRDNIWANRYTAGAGWGTAALIETDNAGNANSVQIAFDASGNAVAVWSQSDGTFYNIWANRYTAGAGWGTAALIETDNAGNAHSAQIAFDASGNALAVWQQSDSARYNIWANRYTAGAGWGTAALIETNDDGEATFPQIAFDASGNALAVWQHSDGICCYNIMANRYTAGVGWGVPAKVENDDTGHAVFPQIAFDASGNALAVWQQSTTIPIRYDIWANRYTAGTGWGTAVPIETENLGHALSPQIAVDAAGNALALWHGSDGARTNIWANRYTVAGLAWGTAALIETDNLGAAQFPQVAVDATTGNALVVWHQSDGTRDNIWSNRYIAGSGWDSAALIETDNLGNAGYPQIAVDANGNAFAVWHQSDGTRYNIWANRYE